MQQILPQGWTIGQQVEVKLWGSNLADVTSLRIESPEIEASVVTTSATLATIRISSKAKARPGLHRLYLIARHGLSNPFLFRLTGYSSVLEAEPNDELENAQTINDRTTMNGVITDIDDADFYRLDARRGETLAFQILLGRNGYATGGEIGNVTLTLLNRDGRVLERNFGRFLWDPYFQHTFQDDGRYYLVVEHARLAVTCFVNNCEHRRIGESYQLALGRSPVLWSVWPPVVEPGKSYNALLRADFLDPSGMLVVSGSGVSATLDGAGERPGEWRTTIQVAADSEEGPRLLSVTDRSGNSFPLSVTVAKGNLRVEGEPNDSPETAKPQAKPLLLLGRMDRSGDVDSFPIQANESEALVLQVDARRIGSAMLDPHLTLLAADGDLVAVNDDAAPPFNPRSRDSRLDLKIPNAPNCAKRSDRFVAQVRDNSRHADESRFYLLSVREQSPTFDLALQSERIFVQRGDSVTVPITLRRREGFDADVTVSVDNLPAGLSAEALVIGPTATSGKLRLSATTSADPGITTIAVFGAAKIGDRMVTQRAAIPNPFLGDGFAYMDWPEPQLWLSVTPAVPFSLEQMQSDRNITGGRNILSLGRGGEADLLVKVDRAADFDGPLSIAVEGLPAGLTLHRTEWTDEGRIARLVVKALAEPKVNLGEYPVAVTGSGTMGDNRWSESTRTFLLRVEP